MENLENNHKSTSRSGLWRGITVVGLIVVLMVGALVAYRLISGRSLGLNSFARDTLRYVVDFSKAILGHNEIVANNHGKYTNIIFLHHSVGQNLIEQGGVRQLFNEAGYDFWDHDYNYIGLTTPDGTPAGYSYEIPDDNTNPDGLFKLFQQSYYSTPINAFSRLMQHEVIIFKSCYPASDITSNEELETRKQWYLTMRDRMDLYPNKLFIFMTQPPLNPAETDMETAARARAFADWLKSDEFLAGHPNVFTFDLFNLLAENNPTALEANMLRADYQQGSDSHPNQAANQAIGPIFVQFVVNAIEG